MAADISYEITEHLGVFKNEKNGWTREELEQHFFRGTEIYEDVWNALVPEKGSKDYEYSCFTYDGQKYRLKLKMEN